MNRYEVMMVAIGIGAIVLGVWLTYLIGTSDLPMWVKFMLLK